MLIYTITAEDYFYPRSPCGERLKAYRQASLSHRISIHALLAESDETPKEQASKRAISIHALLAESDQSLNLPSRPIDKFLSTLSLRRATPYFGGYIRSDRTFLSTLSLRRATRTFASLFFGCFYFYPRSPCGERPTKSDQGANNQPISIHALLAESDADVVSVQHGRENFYPRSPCGERLCGLTYLLSVWNFYPRSPCGERR